MKQIDEKRFLDYYQGRNHNIKIVMEAFCKLRDGLYTLSGFGEEWWGDDTFNQDCYFDTAMKGEWERIFPDMDRTMNSIEIMKMLMIGAITNMGPFVQLLSEVTEDEDV